MLRRSFIKSTVIGLAGLSVPGVSHAATSLISSSTNIIPYNIGEVDGFPVLECVFLKGQARLGVGFINDDDFDETRTVLIPCFQLTEQGWCLPRSGKGLVAGDKKTINPPVKFVIRHIRMCLMESPINFAGHQVTNDSVCVCLARNEAERAIGVAAMSGWNWKPVYSHI